LSGNSLKEFLKVSDEFDRLDKQKLIISSIIFEKMKEKELSIRKLAQNIEGVGPAQISRILHGENYNIMTLLKILDFLELDLDFKDRVKS
jgi:transcriptional regulator with XRE-family HTH domain